jgi:hypothetical protein
LHLFIVILPWICLDQPHWPVLGNKETDNSKLYWMPFAEITYEDFLGWLKDGFGLFLKGG